MITTRTAPSAPDPGEEHHLNHGVQDVPATAVTRRRSVQSRFATSPAAPPPPVSGSCAQLADGEWNPIRFVPNLPPLIRYGGETGQVRLSPQDLEQALSIVRRVVPATAEILCGQRAVDQVTRWMTPDLFEAVARRAGLAARVLGPRNLPRPLLRRAQVQPTLSGACEALVVLSQGTRVHGAAARLERHRDRWVLSTLAIP